MAHITESKEKTKGRNPHREPADPERWAPLLYRGSGPCPRKKWRKD